MPAAPMSGGGGGGRAAGATSVTRGGGRGWLASAGLVVLVAVAVFGDHGVVQLWRLRTEVQTLHQEVAVLEAENQRLSRAITDLRENPLVIERIAREELGLVRPGERVLRFPRSPRAGPATGTTAPNPPRSP